MPFIDLHAHYPMHLDFPPVRLLDSQDNKTIRKGMGWANKLANRENIFSGPRVSRTKARRGRLKAFGSVLYNPADEFYKQYKPFEALLALSKQVEKKMKASEHFQMARNGTDLKCIVDAGERIAVFHCIEGAYAIEDPCNVAGVASMRVAYVVVAHLLYRGIARNVNAFACLNDTVYEKMWWQPPGGLSPKGKAICQALCDANILLDITHSDEQSIDDIFEIAGKSGKPVITSHTAARCIHKYKQKLNISDHDIGRIRDTGGLIGIIFYNHWLKTKNPPEKEMELLCEHIDHIAKVCGSAKEPNYDHIAIGSDLDGFIKPVKGLETLSDAPKLESMLEEKFPEKKFPKVAKKILYKNALRVLAEHWG